MRISVFLLFIFIALNGYAQTTWQLAKEKKGIKVYTGKNDSSAFKSIKVETVLDGSWQKLSDILIDVKRQPEWVYHSRKTEVIKRISAQEVLYYAETALPWPLNNRDAVVRIKIFYDPALRIGKVSSTSEQNQLPPKNGLVRVAHYKAAWEVRVLDENKLGVTYFLQVDPGGSIPAAVVNMFVSSGPYETFNRLAELLRK
jgi:hypothetical protein